MNIREYLFHLPENVCIDVSPRFEGDIVVYSAVYVLEQLLREKGKEVVVNWPGHFPPAASRLFPITVSSDGSPSGSDIKIDKGLLVIGNKEFSFRHTPVELMIDGYDETEDVLAAMFISLYAGTRGFSVESVDDDVFLWFENLLKNGFPHYKYVDLIYVISSPQVFHVWGDVMKKARLDGDKVVSVYEGEDKLLPPEWLKVASYLGRFTGKGIVYVKRNNQYEYFTSDGERGMVSDI